MKKLIIGLTIALLVVFITQLLFIKYTPDLVYRIAVRRAGGSLNHWINAPKTDASLRRVVLPNPDFVYSALFYDVSKKDVIVSGVFPDSSYASIAFYDDRCQPFFVYNNLAEKQKGNFRFELSKDDRTGPGQLKPKMNKGVIICRFLMTTDSSYQKMLAYQQLLKSELK